MAAAVIAGRKAREAMKLEEKEQERMEELKQAAQSKLAQLYAGRTTGWEKDPYLGINFDDLKTEFLMIENGVTARKTMIELKDLDEEVFSVMRKLHEETVDKERKRPRKNPDNYKDWPRCQQWIMMSAKVETVTNPNAERGESDWFGQFIIIVIIVAGVMVGIQQYDGMDKNTMVMLIDDIILVIFSVECLLKMASEGMEPWMYFVGKEWKWNNFDFVIVMLCMPFFGDMFGGGSVALLRLARLMRVMKLVKKIPQLQMIIMGLVGGFRSIGYIMMLMGLVFYLYAIFGIMFFGKNDPFHFGTLPVAMNTLFRMSTLEDWTDVMYINYFGCGSPMFGSGLYSDHPRDIEGERLDRTQALYEAQIATHGQGGDIDTPVLVNSTYSPSYVPCDPNKAPNKAIVILYMLTFVVVSALVVLSLVIGAITMSMSTSLQQMKNMTENKKRESKRKAEVRRLEEEQIEKRRVDMNSALAEVKAAKRELARLQKTGASAADIAACEERVKKADATMENRITQQNDAPKLNLRRVCSIWFVRCTGGGDDMNDREKLRILLTKLWSAQTQSRAKSRRNRAESVYSQQQALKKEDAHVCFGSEALAAWWISCAEVSTRIARAGWFQNGITATIVLAGALVGIQTDRALAAAYETPFFIVDTIILAIFIVEIVVKVVAQEFRPWMYFFVRGKAEAWNWFDFIVVLGSVIPTGQGNLVVILRLLRLLRVLKLLRAFPGLQVIVVALISGLGSIGYIAVIMVLFFYVWGILGMMMFATNDPWHFGTLHDTIITLFRASTLEDWTDVMYTNMYGCDHWGYSREAFDADGVNLCTQPYAWGAFATAYFWLLIIIGSFVIMPLFIGVVVSGMEEAVEKQNDEKKMYTKLRRVMRRLYGTFHFKKRDAVTGEKVPCTCTIKNCVICTDQSFSAAPAKTCCKAAVSDGPKRWTRDEEYPEKEEKRLEKDYWDLFNLIDVDGDTKLDKKEILTKLREALTSSDAEDDAAPIVIDEGKVDKIIEAAVSPATACKCDGHGGKTATAPFCADDAKVDFANFVALIHNLSLQEQAEEERSQRSEDNLDVQDVTDSSEGGGGGGPPTQARSGSRSIFRGTQVVPVDITEENSDTRETK